MPFDPNQPRDNSNGQWTGTGGSSTGHHPHVQGQARAAAGQAGVRVSGVSESARRNFAKGMEREFRKQEAAKQNFPKDSHVRDTMGNIGRVVGHYSGQVGVQFSNGYADVHPSRLFSIKK